jgi:hypothetical protein
MGEAKCTISGGGATQRVALMEVVTGVAVDAAA